MVAPRPADHTLKVVGSNPTPQPNQKQNPQHPLRVLSFCHPPTAPHPNPGQIHPPPTQQPHDERATLSPSKRSSPGDVVFAVACFIRPVSSGSLHIGIGLKRSR